MNKKDNFVIEVLNEKHGQRVIDYFKSIGVDTNILEGTCTRENGGTARYYGVFNDYFDNYPLKVVQERGMKIIELPEKIENMAIRVISPVYAQRIINCACPTWKKILAEKWAYKIVINEAIQVEESFYKQMRKACTDEQNKIFDDIFGKDEIEINLLDSKTLKGFVPYEEVLDGSLIGIRCEEEYQNKAFILSPFFDWEIKKDSKGIFCLIPKPNKSFNQI